MGRSGPQFERPAHTSLQESPCLKEEAHRSTERAIGLDAQSPAMTAEVEAFLSAGDTLRRATAAA